MSRLFSCALLLVAAFAISNLIVPARPAEKVDLLELVWSSVLRLYDREAALAWLFGVNPRLGDRRPIDLVRAGRAEELMRALRAERSDSFA